MSFDAVVSPYHLTTREAPAMAALLLCDRVVTMMPAPVGEGARRQAERLAERAPRYARLVESWSWSVPLWNAGVLTAELQGCSPSESVQEAHADIMSRVEFSSIRPLRAEYPDESSYLHALAHDLLRGGPDPALTIPVAAGLDRFASLHQLAVARSQPASLAQRHEERLWKQLASIAVPVLLEGRAERLLDARELLDMELGALRAAMEGEIAGEGDSELRSVAAAYRRAFERIAPHLAEPDPQEARVVVGEVSVRIVEMPGDAALLASARAAAAIVRESARPVTGAIALAGGRTISFVVRVLGRR